MPFPQMFTQIVSLYSQRKSNLWQTTKAPVSKAHLLMQFGDGMVQHLRTRSMLALQELDLKESAPMARPSGSGSGRWTATHKRQAGMAVQNARGPVPRRPCLATSAGIRSRGMIGVRVVGCYRCSQAPCHCLPPGTCLVHHPTSIEGDELVEPARPVESSLSSRASDSRSLSSSCKSPARVESQRVNSHTQTAPRVVHHLGFLARTKKSEIVAHSRHGSS